jgi:hypothetical protein
VGQIARLTDGIRGLWAGGLSGRNAHLFGKVIDVQRDFGAVGDGVTDDTAAIQAAIDAITKTGNGSGGTVLLPAGTYVLTATLNLSKRFMFRLLGIGSSDSLTATKNTVTLLWNGANGGTVLNMNQCRDCVVEGFRIMPGTGTISVGIDIDNAAPITVNASHNVVRNVTIDTSTTAIQIAKTSTATSGLLDADLGTSINRGSAVFVF